MSRKNRQHHQSTAALFSWRCDMWLLLKVELNPVVAVTTQVTTQWFEFSCRVIADLRKERDLCFFSVLWLVVVAFECEPDLCQYMIKFSFWSLQVFSVSNTNINSRRTTTLGFRKWKPDKRNNNRQNIKAVVLGNTLFLFLFDEKFDTTLNSVC